MGTWGTAISSNDGYADVYSEFFDLYNSGKSVEDISTKLKSSYREMIGFPEDANNFWFALAKAQWECKQLDPEILRKVTSIIDNDIDIAIWRDLGATEKDLIKRQQVLNKFLSEISSERSKAKARKKIKIAEPAFAKGDCIVFKLSNGNYGGAVVLEAVYNTPYGHNLVAITDLNQLNTPTTKDFIKANVLIKNFAAWDNKPAINWISDIKFPIPNHPFETIGKIEIQINYNIKDYKYMFSGSFERVIIDSANNQFQHELSNPKPKTLMPIKDLVKKKWKLW